MTCPSNPIGDDDIVQNLMPDFKVETCQVNDLVDTYNEISFGDEPTRVDVNVYIEMPSGRIGFSPDLSYSIETSE